MHSRELWARFLALDIDASSLGLEAVQKEEPVYFCTPVGAEILGSLGVDGIRFAFLPGEEMVYCVSPMVMEEGKYVLPVAEDVLEFLSFVLFCRDAAPLEQLWWMDAAQFHGLLAEAAGRRWEGCEEFLAQKEKALAAIEKSFHVEPQDPFEKVKALQTRFDPETVPFSEEYYETLGIEKRPKG